MFGCGAIGSMSIIIAKGMGAKKIIGIDMNEDNLKLASDIGADEVIKLEPKKVKNPGHTMKKLLEK